MARTKTEDKTEPKSDAISVSAEALANALVHAQEAANPRKKTITNRRKNSPWTKTGEKKPKLKRKFYQHGIEIQEKFLTAERIELINQLRPGAYKNYFKVVRRRDKGIDIDYPVKTNAQRLRMITEFGIRDLTELLRFLIEESKKPKVEVEDE